MPRVRRALVLVLSLLCGVGCGGASAEPELPPEATDAPTPSGWEPEPARVDVSQVVWPATPATLPANVPWWANDFSHPGHSPPHRPTLPDTGLSYARLQTPSRPGSLGPTVIYCEVAYARTTDDPTPIFRDASPARADLTVLGTFGTGFEFQAIGLNNAPRVVFGVPVTALRVGDVVSMRAWDRDFVAHDPVGTLAGSYAGTLPFTLGAGDLTATCAAEAQGVVLSYVSSLMDAADQAIARVILSPPSVPEGEPVERLVGYEEAREAVSYAADWLTWTHPDVQLRRARLDVLLNAHLP